MIMDHGAGRMAGGPTSPMEEVGGECTVDVMEEGAKSNSALLVNQGPSHVCPSNPCQPTTDKAVKRNSAKRPPPK